MLIRPTGRFAIRIRFHLSQQSFEPLLLGYVLIVIALVEHHLRQAGGTD